MRSRESYLRAIRAAYPEIRVGSVTYNADGQNNDVLILDGEWIFRFPKYAHALQRLRTEVAILVGIRDAVPLAVPVPTFLNLEGAPVGEAFMGYRMIPGNPLWRETLNAIQDDQVRDGLARQLGTFLRALHAVPVDSAIAVALPASNPHAKYTDLYQRIQQQLFPSMRPDARTRAATHFETFLGDPTNMAHTPVLRHGDFGTSNILFDPATQMVTGIIDFGSAGMGDPATDLAGLLSQYGEGFVRRLSGDYPGLDACWHRVVFYQGTFALQEALFGIEHDDPAAFEHGLARYV